MFPHREPSFHTDWWTIDRLVPILLVLLIIGVVVWAVVRLTRQATPVPAGAAGPGPGSSPPWAFGDPALEQARLRYGRGEVDRDTFLRIVGDLSLGDVEPDATDEPPPSAAP